MAFNEGEVILRLTGDNFDPDRVTEFLGIQPSYAKKKGSPTPKCSIWEFSLGKTDNEIVDIYDMATKLVNQLEPKVDLLINAIAKFDLSCVMQVVLWITMDESKSTPAIGFECETISLLNKLNAFIDIDTYRH